MLTLGGGKFNEARGVVRRVRFLAALKHATDAAVCDGMPASFRLNRNRLHCAAADGGAVSGTFVQMLAPQARGTVVGVAVPRYMRAALLTRKVFYFSGETH